MGRIACIALFGILLAGSSGADPGAPAPNAGAADPAQAPRARMRIVGAFCDAPGCATRADSALGQGTAFAAVTLAALWMRRRRD